jgi:DNA-binding transcriptional MerR regulator
VTVPQTFSAGLGFADIFSDLPMKIGELAKRAGVSVQAIRFYERRRLIRTPRRTPAGYRMYSDQDLECVTVIKKMQRFGFKLTEIRRVLQLWILPTDTGAPSPYHEGSRQCLRESLKLGEKKLQAMDEQIRSAAQVRDELQAVLHQIRAALNAPAPPKARSGRPKSPQSAATATS